MLVEDKHISEIAVLKKHIENLESACKKLDEQNDRYLDYVFQFLVLILKYQAGDISKEELFEETKKVTKPNIYERIYHQVVLKDFMQDISQDETLEDDTESLEIIA